MNCIIVDDEIANIKLLQSLIEIHFSGINIIGSARSKTSAVKLLDLKQPELVFLDINLDSNQTGFDILMETKHTNVKVIFVTSHKDFAIKAFNYNTLGYLLKPIEQEKFIFTVNKAIKELKSQQYTSTPQIKSLERTLNKLNSHKFIAIPTTKNIEFIKMEEIIYLSSDGRYTIFFISNKKNLISSKNIGEYEKLLDPYFFRIHAKYIVNMNFIKQIHKDSGAPYCELLNGALLSISQRKQAPFLKYLNLKS